MKPGKADDPGARARGALLPSKPERNLPNSSALSHARLVAEGGDTDRGVLELPGQEPRRSICSERDQECRVFFGGAGCVNWNLQGAETLVGGERARSLLAFYDHATLQFSPSRMKLYLSGIGHFEENTAQKSQGGSS